MKLASPCALFEMHRCDAPCVGAQSTDSYASVATEVREFLHGDASRVESELRKRMSDLALDERFEDALLIRNRLSAFARGVGRGQEIRSLSRVPEMVIRKDRDLLLIRYGKLAASMVMPDVEQQTFDDVIHRIRSMGEHVVDDGSVIPSGNYEESEKLSRLVKEGVELLWIDEAVAWSMPRASAASMRFRLAEDLSDALSKSEGIDRMGKDSIRARPSR